MRLITKGSRLARAALAAAAGCATVLSWAAVSHAGTVGQEATPSRAARTAVMAASSFGGTSQLTDVSCRSQSWCMAVGQYTTTDKARHSLAAIWTGSGWRTLKNPPGIGLPAVACSSEKFCMAGGGPTGVMTWNGSVWRKIAAPSGGLSGVTCASRTLCMTTVGQAFYVWNGTSWHNVKQISDFCNGTAPGPCGISGLSCGSTTNCMAVGTWTVSQEPVQETLGWFWNGKTWSFVQPPGAGNPAESNAVSCAGGFCMATGSAYSEVAGGGIATAGTWSAATTTWTDVSPNLGTLCTGALVTCDWAGQVACSGPSNCMTLGGVVGSQLWNGTGWQAEKTISAGRGSGLTSISCGGSDCLAVGWRTSSGKRRTLAELWSGSSWAIVGSPK